MLFPGENKTRKRAKSSFRSSKRRSNVTYGSKFYTLLVPGEQSFDFKVPFKSKQLLANYYKRIGKSREDFLNQAKKLKYIEKEKSEYVPFVQYYPTYQDMDKSQQDWYFYWRSEVRKDNFIKTDLSYILVYIYELINLVHIDENPNRIYNILVKIWKQYRRDFVTLDKNLIFWIADFIIVHGLDKDPLDWYNEIFIYKSKIPLNERESFLEAILKHSPDLSSLSMPFIYQICGYSPEKNKFYKELNKKINLDHLFRLGLISLNNYFKETKKIPYFDQFKSETPVSIVRYAFSGAISNYNKTEIEIGKIYPRMNSEFLNSLELVLKYIENLLRRKVKFRSRIQLSEKLPADWEQVLQKCYSGIVFPSEITTTLNIGNKRVFINNLQTSPIDDIKIDFQKVEILQSESEDIRTRLILEEHETNAELALPYDNNSRIQNEYDKSTFSNGIDLNSAHEELTNDLKSFVLQMRKHHWQALVAIVNSSHGKDSKKILQEIAKNTHITFDQLLDELNEVALESLFDILIDVSQEPIQIEEEYIESVKKVLSWINSTNHFI